MRILLIADGRSPITRNWLRMLASLDWHIALVSTFPCQPPPGVELLDTLPAGFATQAGGQVATAKQSSATGNLTATKGWKRSLLNRARPLLRALRAQLGPLTLSSYQQRLLEIAAQEKPDLAHALRIPFEGMLATALPAEIPLLVSIWGNDLTLHARSSTRMASYTRRCLQRTDGLLADASRDLRLAAEWGLRGSAPRLVLPGNGGLDFGLIQAVLKDQKPVLPFNLPVGRPIVVNPRGFRPGSVHQNIFFRSIPLVLKRIPEAFFVCTAMQGQPQAENWVKKMNLQEHVLLLPYLPQKTLWQLFARSQVYLSLSSHDGTPNTFLEALACGCFPVIGDIESLREWIDDSHNGLLVDPRDEQAAADAVARALNDSNLRRQASRHNRSLLRERANLPAVCEQFNAFAAQVIEQKRSAGAD